MFTLKCTSYAVAAIFQCVMRSCAVLTTSLHSTLAICHYVCVKMLRAIGVATLIEFYWTPPYVWLPQMNSMAFILVCQVISLM